MYSKKFIKILVLQSKISYFMGSSPLLMDPEKEILYATKLGKVKSFGFWFILTEYATIFIPYQLVKMWNLGNFQQFNYVMILWLGLILACIFLGCFNLQNDQVRELLNMYLVFVKNFQKQYLPNHNPNTAFVNKIMDRILVWSSMCYFWFGILLSTHYAIFPRSAFHLTTEIDPNFFYSFFYIPYGLALTWVILSICSLFSMCTSAILTYVAFLVPIQSKEFRVDNIHGQKSNDKLRTAKYLPKTYRCFELLTNFQNITLSQYLIPCQTAIMYLILFCNTMLIRRWEKLNAALRVSLILLSVLAMFLWGLVLKVFGRMDVWSQKTLKSWKDHNWGSVRDNKYMRKFRKSCRPLRIGYGRCYIIRPLSVLKFLKGISRGTFRALLLAMKNE
ncbi:unnamed protein product [Orchesella dallaii]|uniref:Odorant receptor n=1 Tax=Orchesella dallaii TaxID=48710 RepID=A0ABP1PR08_9HEXA